MDRSMTPPLPPKAKPEGVSLEKTIAGRLQAPMERILAAIEKADERTRLAHVARLSIVRIWHNRTLSLFQGHPPANLRPDRPTFEIGIDRRRVGLINNPQSTVWLFHPIDRPGTRRPARAEDALSAALCAFAFSAQTLPIPTGSAFDAWIEIHENALT